MLSNPCVLKKKLQFFFIKKLKILRKVLRFFNKLKMNIMKVLDPNLII